MQPASHPDIPDRHGQFGPYGGRYMPETLIPALDELERAFRALREDPDFWRSFRAMLADYVGRPSPLFLAEGISDELGGARIYLKREDLNHTGAHKINNCLGQILLARRMGKRRIIAETGAGQHGVATATVCALYGLQCVVYMGAQDMARQSVNVRRMRMLGAQVRAVHTGTATLKDAMNEALRDWIANVADTYYLLGTGAGPHPYPWLVREFQRVIGDETREQILARTGRLPDAMVACVGGGSNALGFFYPFLGDAGVRMIGVEAGGLGLASGAHAASLGPAAPACCTAATAITCRTRTARSSTRIRSRRAWTTRRGAGTCAAARPQARGLCLRDRRAGRVRLPLADPPAGHPAGAGKRPCAGSCARTRAPHAARRHPDRVPERARRQGPGHRYPI